MVTVAVAGVASLLGQSVVRRLERDDTVEAIVGLDRRRPDFTSSKLTVALTDLRTPDLADLLDNVDVVVNLATVVPHAEPAARFAMIVWGTRALIAAAKAKQVSAFVQMSTAMAYGARADNPVPLTEHCALRAEPGFAAAYHAVLAEELVAELASEEIRTVVLRPAPVLGQTDESPMLRHLESPLLTLVSEHDPPVQFCDQSDLAVAVHLAIDPSNDLRGAYNVASDGWLTAAELAHLLGRPRVHVPEAVARAVVGPMARVGLLEAADDWLHYLMYPWVVDTTALKKHGWNATLSNRELVRAFVAEHRDVWRIGPLRLSRRRLAVGAGAVSAMGATAMAVLAAVAYRYWWRRR